MDLGFWVLGFVRFRGMRVTNVGVGLRTLGLGYER
jgi:hypothetical protein